MFGRTQGGGWSKNNPVGIAEGEGRSLCARMEGSARYPPAPRRSIAAFP